MKWSSIVSSFRLSLRRFTDRAIKVLNLASEQAADRGQPATAEHVLLALALVEPGPGHLALARVGLDLNRERDAIAALLTEQPRGEPVKRVASAAVSHARDLGHRYVGTEHLALALLSPGPAADFLRERGISPEELREAVLAVLRASR